MRCVHGRPGSAPRSTPPRLSDLDVATHARLVAALAGLPPGGNPTVLRAASCNPARLPPEPRPARLPRRSRSLLPGNIVTPGFVHPRGRTPHEPERNAGD
jgi:hypothetical protein